MLVNADCTIYEADTYTKHTLRDVYWHDSRGRTIIRGGIQVQDSLLVYLYDDAYVPKAGDLIVRGSQDFSFDTQSQQAVSQSMKQFRVAYPGFAVVKNVDNAMYGGLPHIEVIAR